MVIGRDTWRWDAPISVLHKHSNGRDSHEMIGSIDQRWLIFVNRSSGAAVSAALIPAMFQIMA